MRWVLVVACLRAGVGSLFLLPAAQAAVGIAQVTVMDGDASFIRGGLRFGLGEGVRLARFDRVQTEANAFVRLAFNDGTLLDLGPATRVEIDAPSARRGGRMGPYLLAGLAKLVAPRSATEKVGLVSPYLETLAGGGVPVVRVGRGTANVYVEDGAVSVSVHARSAQETWTLRNGQFLVVREGAASNIEARTSAAFASFAAALPKQFKDSIPSPPRREAAPRPLGAITYAQVEPWLDAAEPQIRNRSVEFWRDKADEAAFRQALLADIDRHPEWIKVLFPQNEDGKPRPGDTGPQGDAKVSPPSGDAGSAAGTAAHELATVPPK